MTNSDLKRLRDTIIAHLKPKLKGKNFIIKENDSRSTIKEINLCFQNRDDVLVIQQDIETCKVIDNLFEGKRLESCDFIVLICKKTNLYVYFCEIKSSNTNNNRIKAMRQIQSSIYFLDFVFKNYNHCKETEIFGLGNCEIKKIMIYPATMSQKNNTALKGQLFLAPIACNEDGIFEITNAYNFFDKF